MFKILNNKGLIVKWFLAVVFTGLFLVSFLGVWISSKVFVNDYWLVGFTSYTFIFLFFLLPLIKAILVSQDENAELQHKVTYIMQGIIGGLLVYSSYMAYVFESEMVGLWLWISSISALTLIVIDIIRIFLKTESTCLKKSAVKKVGTFINRITLHCGLIVIVIFGITVIYHPPREVHLDNMKAPATFGVMKMDAKKKGIERIVDRIYLNNENTIKEIFNEIKDNKKVDSIRGAEYVRFEKAYNRNDFYYWLIPFYDEHIKEERIDQGYFDKIIIQPNGYVVIEERKHKHPFNLFKYPYFRYKIKLSQNSIDKIIKTLLESK